MKRLAMAAMAAMAMGGAALGGAARADPVEGIWQTEPDAGSYAHVQMAPCGAAICGTFLKTFKDGGEYQSPNLGKKVVIDMVPKGDGSYSGQVWRPSNDKIYTGKMRLSGNALAMSGCIMGGLYLFEADLDAGEIGQAIPFARDSARLE